MTAKYYVNEVGVRINIATLNTAIPVTTTITIIITKPSKTQLIVSPTSINYSTGMLRYDTVAGDLSEPGTYKVQVRGQFDDGDDLKSDVDDFVVYS